MANLNKIMIIGRLGKDPEVRNTQSGKAVASLSVATSEKWTGADGNQHEATEWHRIVVWGNAASYCAKYLEKGCLVYVEGKLQTRSWEDKGGQTRYVTEINAQIVQGLDRGQKSPQNWRSDERKAKDPDGDGECCEFDDDADDIPF